MTNDYHQLPADRKTSDNLIPKQTPQKQQKVMSWSQFQNNGRTWEDYKLYLKKHGCLSPNLYNTI